MTAGRPTKYNPATVKKLTDAIRVGATFGLACSFAGISEDTFARWRARHADFAEAIKEAEGAAAIKYLAQIDKAAAEGTWQAAAWKLERRWPRDYGRQVIEHQHKVDWSRVPDEALDGFLSKKLTLADVSELVNN